MSSRENILKSIREASPEKPSNLPDVHTRHTTFEDLKKAFSTSLTSVGGSVEFIDNLDAVRTFLVGCFQDASVMVSTVPGLDIGTKKSNETDDPHSLEDVDLAIIRGEFAVAENGAVWLKKSDAMHRALFFIAQKLVIVVPRDEIVHTMHEAYARIAFETGDTFGLFISGPSKTADIEQSLVIGAHGATETHVIFTRLQ